MSRRLLEAFEFTFADHGTYQLDDLLATASWHPAKMPGDSIQHLRDAGLETADPLQGDNQKVYLSYEKCDFIYRTRLSMQDGFSYLLTGHGLDTFCDIYWDGKLIHRSESSFVRLHLDLTKFGSAGEHELVFVFLSPIATVAERYPDFEAGQYSVVFDEPLRILMRKPQFHYGWDNAPHLAGVGFIGTPYLTESRQPVSVRDLNFDYAYDWRAKHAVFSIRLSGEAHHAARIRPALSFAGHRVWEGGLFEIAAGEIRDLTISRGELGGIHEWQVRGYGQPNLYKLVLETESGETLWRERVGFRHVELSTRVTERRTVNFRVGPVDQIAASMDGSAADKNPQLAASLVINNLPAGPWSKVKTEPYETDVCDFRIIVNGVPIFLRGFNWQPLEQSLANISDDRWKLAFARYDESQANILRIWGGGYIEDERLYRFCDEAGIFLWQDFQFACALYPDRDPALRALVAAEVRDIYLRLHLHPCVGIFCGSNEIDMMLYDRGQDIPTSNSIGHALIPETLRQLHSTIPYHVSSPSSNDYPRSPFSGETRNWTAREYVEDDYPLLRSDSTSMNSEGGAPAFPGRALTAAFLPNEQPDETVWVEDPTYQLHAGSTLKWDRGKDYFAGMYRNTRQCFSDWKSLDELIYLTQLAQADALTRYVEIFRSKELNCSGCVIWKFSDLWPCIELSVVDYDLRPKMAHYAIRRAFADTIICPFFQDDCYTFSVSSNLPLGEGSLVVEYLRMDGSVFFQKEVPLSITAGITHSSLAIPRAELRETHGMGDGVFRARLLVKGGLVTEKIFFPEIMSCINFTKIDRVDFSLSEGVRKSERYQYELALQASVTLLGVNIRLRDEKKTPLFLSDNAFPMIQDEQRRITLESASPLTKDDLEIQTLNSLS